MIVSFLESTMSWGRDITEEACVSRRENSLRNDSINFAGIFLTWDCAILSLCPSVTLNWDQPPSSFLYFFFLSFLSSTMISGVGRLVGHISWCSSLIPGSVLRCHCCSTWGTIIQCQRQNQGQLHTWQATYPLYDLFEPTFLLYFSFL